MLAVALVGAATLSQAADSAPGPSGEHSAGAHGGAMMHRGPMAGDMHAGMPGMLPERALERVGATAEQKAKVRAIMRAAHDDMQKQHESQLKLHRQLAATLAAPQLDPAAAEALRQQLSAGHDAASKRMLQAMLDASAVLTPEQRQKLGEQMGKRREMMERHRHEREAIDGPRS